MCPNLVKSRWSAGTLIDSGHDSYGVWASAVESNAKVRWTGRTLRMEIEGWVDPELPAKDADALGRLVAEEISRQLP